MPRISRIFLLVAMLSAVSMATGARADVFEAVRLPLTKLDLQKMTVAAQPLLDDDLLPVGTKRAWFNIRSGNHGLIRLLGRFEYEHRGSKLSCRSLLYQVKLLPPPDIYNLLINRCKVADGSWKSF